jgi:NAD+ synthase (glutamine-hydrolysing)
MMSAVDFTELGFVRVAAAAPPLHLADPAANADEIAAWARRAAERGAAAVVFPELAVTGYSCEDLFHSEALLAGARGAVRALAKATADLAAAIVVGAPYRTPDGRLYNCAFVLSRGRVRGAIPKTYLPNYGEFYERRWFVPGGEADLRVSDALLGDFRLGPRQLFEAGPLVFAVEVCEDLWAPVPPSCAHALAGATVLFGLNASNELVAKADYRRDLVRQQSARLNAAYVYVSSGPGESTKDLVFGGHAIVAEYGSVLAEGRRFALEGAMVTADLDVERLLHERARNITYGASASPRAAYSVEILDPPPALASLDRAFARTPFVPDDPATVNERAREILSIQSTGLARRLQASRSDAAVIGVSGGLDSTLALLVSVEAMRLLGRPASRVLAVSMPGFGTTEGTRGSAADLAARLGVDFREISIARAVEQHFRDIGHDPRAHDVVFENAQARERTQILFDLANEHRGIVVGTGDMSELALGWCTYNADHMANYAVNVSVPKTLVKHLVRWYAEHVADAPTRAVLEKILATTISPELLPPAADGGIAQATEELIGPYVLHDFFLYHHLRNGFRPRKVHALASLAFSGQYSAAELKKWLRVFMERFYLQQFKRTCLPPGPKVGTVSLSPRGDLRMPDEADPAALLREVDALP